jgi:hypothetical protein
MPPASSSCATSRCWLTNQVRLGKVPAPSLLGVLFGGSWRLGAMPLMHSLSGSTWCTVVGGCSRYWYKWSCCRFLQESCAASSLRRRS